MRENWITSSRFGVTFMPAMMASYLPAWSAGMMPSQSWATTSHLTFMRRQSSIASSGSKPSSLPCGVEKFHGA